MSQIRSSIIFSNDFIAQIFQAFNRICWFWVCFGACFAAVEGFITSYQYQSVRSAGRCMTISPNPARKRGSRRCPSFKSKLAFADLYLRCRKARRSSWRVRPKDTVEMRRSGMPVRTTQIQHVRDTKTYLSQHFGLRSIPRISSFSRATKWSNDVCKTYERSDPMELQCHDRYSIKLERDCTDPVSDVQQSSYMFFSARTTKTLLKEDKKGMALRTTITLCLCPFRKFSSVAVPWSCSVTVDFRSNSNGIPQSCVLCAAPWPFWYRR